MSRIQGARERARSQVTAAIKDEARRQLADGGAAKLSLRAVARELGMVSSALYRYFPSRDDLLTALIIDSYDAAGAAAEKALAEAETQGDSHLARWQAICRGVRSWALDHPHEYALLYGSPVPGYSAPESTVGPASRVALALLAVVRDAHEAGALRHQDSSWPARSEAPTTSAAPAPSAVREDAAKLAERLGVRLPPEVTAELVAAWAQLFGLLSFEVFGQFRNVVGARAEFFDHAVVRLADGVGLVPAAP